MTLIQITLLFSAAFAAGMINSVAGGGTMVSFPTLVWVGRPELIANATNTLAMVPGAISSAFGYRSEMDALPRKLFVLLVPSVIGSLLGAWLLTLTPPATFAAIVPWLILFATGLFILQEPVQRKLRTTDVGERPITNAWLAGASVYQILVAIYGGYFGAGIGILMLAALGMMGMKNIHQMNGLKNIFGTAINGLAAVYFIFSGLIDWPSALLMTVGSILGGYSAAGLARRMSQRTVRKIVIAIGIAMAVSLFFKKN